MAIVGDAAGMAGGPMVGANVEPTAHAETGMAEAVGGAIGAVMRVNRRLHGSAYATIRKGVSDREESIDGAGDVHLSDLDYRSLRGYAGAHIDSCTPQARQAPPTKSTSTSSMSIKMRVFFIQNFLTLV